MQQRRELSLGKQGKRKMTTGQEKIAPFYAYRELSSDTEKNFCLVEEEKAARLANEDFPGRQLLKTCYALVCTALLVKLTEPRLS
jgi:hypothetical protein